MGRTEKTLRQQAKERGGLRSVRKEKKAFGESMAEY